MSNPVNGTIGGFWLTSGVGAGSGKIAPLIAIATVNVADPAALTDGFGAMLSVDATGRLRVQVGAAGIATFPAQAGDDVAARATTATPGAGAALVTIAAGALPAGTYEITATGFFVVVGAVNNAEFREGAAVVSSLQMPAVVNQIPLIHSFRRALDGATAISINATAADAAGTYSAMLIARRVV